MAILYKFPEITQIGTAFYPTYTPGVIAATGGSANPADYLSVVMLGIAGTIDPTLINFTTTAVAGVINGTLAATTLTASATAIPSAWTATTAALKTNSTALATTAFVQANISAIPQTSAPTTGQTISPTAPQMISNHFCNPAGALAALTVTLPTGTLQGQILYVTITQAVTTLTITATNIGTNGIASPTAVATATTFGWHWNQTTTKWNRFL